MKQLVIQPLFASMIGDHISDSASSTFRLLRSLKLLRPLKGWPMSVFIVSDHHGQNFLGIVRHFNRSPWIGFCVSSEQ